MATRCVAGCAACAWGMFPELNELIHLEAFPNDDFRWKVMTLVGMSIVGTFVWDRLCVALFAPKIFKAQLDEARHAKLTRTRTKPASHPSARAFLRPPDPACVRAAPRVSRQARNTSLADMMPAVMSLGKVLGVMLLLGTGNLLLMGLAFMAYKRLTAPQPQQPAA